MTDARVSPRRDGTLNQISMEDEKIVGYTEDGQPIYEGKPVRKRPSLSDIAKEEGQKEIAKQAREGVKEAFGIGGSSAAGAAMTGQSVPATPTIVGANRVDPTTGAILSEGTGVPTSGWDLSNIGSAGNYILPAAGVATLGDLYVNRPENIGHGAGYLQGALGGAAAGSYFGPWGAVAGAGLGLAANAFGIGGESRTKIEEDRRKALAEQGITVPNYDVKEWEQNEAFRESRKEADLKGGDIENSATFWGIQGWDKADQAKKEAIAQQAIDQGLIREHHGTIDLSMTPEYQKYLEEQLGGGDPVSSGGDRRQMEAEVKKQRKRAALSSLLPEITATPTQGPRYDLNPGNLIKNPYL